MKEISICSGEYAAKWGLTDFYSESEKALKDALASGEDFFVTYGCKKEIRYASIERNAYRISIAVTAWMDDLWESSDLIYDALWERLKIESELDDETIDSIRNIAIECCLDDHTSEYSILPVTADFNAICAEIEKLESHAEETNEKLFNELCDIVAEHCSYLKCE